MVLALQVHSLRQFSAEVCSPVVAVSLCRKSAGVCGAHVTARAGSAMARDSATCASRTDRRVVTMSAARFNTCFAAPARECCMLRARILYSASAWPARTSGGEVAVGRPGIFISNVEKYLQPSDLLMGFTKSVVFGFLISSISCAQGYYASGGAKGVGEATTRAVVLSAVAILIANYILTSWLTPV